MTKARPLSPRSFILPRSLVLSSSQPSSNGVREAHRSRLTLHLAGAKAFSGKDGQREREKLVRGWVSRRKKGRDRAMSGCPSACQLDGRDGKSERLLALLNLLSLKFFGKSVHLSFPCHLSPRLD
jgi:hypothetical protein